MPELPPHYTKRTHLSITALQVASRCPRLFMFKTGMRASMFEPHPALMFGTAIHAALPVVLTEGFEAGWEKFREVWRGRDERIEEDEKRNETRAWEMLKNFEEAHRPRKSLYEIVKPPKGAVKRKDSRSDYEVAFAIDIGLEVPLVGWIDAVGRHRDTGELWAVEWKTSSELSSRLFNNLNYAPQPIGYTMALRTLEPSCRGCIVEGLRISAKNSETQANLTYVDDQHIEDFIAWAREWGERILKWEQDSYWPKNLAACSTYPQFGQCGFMCEFAQVCKAKDWRMFESMMEFGEQQGFEVEAHKGAGS